MRKAKQSYQQIKTLVKLIEQQVTNSEQTIIHDCDRKCLDVVTNGAFQFSRACCTGNGFNVMGSLLTLFQQQEQTNGTKPFRRILLRTTIILSLGIIRILM